MLSAQTNSLRNLNLLYERGANFLLRDFYGRDVLSFACTSSAEVLATVLSKGYRPTLDYLGLSPLGLALANESPGVASLALNSALAFDHTNDLSRVNLSMIIRTTPLSLLRKLMRRLPLSSFPFPTHEQTRRSRSVSVLHSAVSVDQPERLEILLHYGADIEYHDENVGTPLIAACATARFACVKTLVRRGSKISYEKDGQTWSAVEAAFRYPDIVAWLLCGRFTSQRALCDIADFDTRGKNLELWSGIEERNVLLSGELGRLEEESLLEQCIRISHFRRDNLGIVVQLVETPA